MEENTRIGSVEALCILLIAVISHLILTLPKVFLDSQGSGAIINVIYVTLVTLLIVFFINLLYKNFHGMDILDISNYLFGKTFRFIVGIVFIASILAVSSLILRNTIENLKTMYFQSTPIPYMIFLVLLPVGYITNHSFKSIIKCNIIIVFLIVLSLFILFLLSFNDFTIERIFPIFGYGAKNIFVNGLPNIFAFSNVLFLFFIMPILNDYSQFKKVSYTSILISGIFILFTIIALTLMFPITISSGSNIPIYMQTKAVTLGKFIQRIDAFYILIWILTILSYLSITMGFVLSIFKKISNVENKTVLSYTFIAILFGLSLLYTDIIQIINMGSQLYKYVALTVGFLSGFIILLLANIKKKFKKQKSF